MLQGAEINKSKHMKKIEIIDFLKGYSIFTIVIFHYLLTLNLPGPYNKLIYFGGTGVHLFIVLSGIGLYLSYLNRPEKYPAFIKKRFSKVYIPYILVVLITAAIVVFYPVIEGSSWYALGGHIFLYKMFDEKIVGSYGYPLWFVSMIFQFYFTFYGIIFFKKKINNDKIFLGLSLAISLGWALLIAATGKESLRVWNSFFLQYLWEFALGMVIASFIYKRPEYKPEIKSIYILIFGIVCCGLYGGLVLMFGEMGKLFNDVPALFGYSAIAIWVYKLKAGVINKFFLFTGKISYPLYLVHSIILSIAGAIFTSLPGPALLIIALCFSYVTSFYYQIVINRLYKILKI